MYKKEIEQYYHKIENFVYKRKLAEAIQNLDVFIKESMSFDLQQDYEQTLENYKYLLGFMIKGVEDPEREKIYNNICCHLLEINDKARQNAFFYCPELPYFKAKNYFNNQGKLSKETAEQLLDKVVSPRVIADMLSDTSVSDDDASLEEQSWQGMEELFRIFWLTDRYDEIDSDLFERIIEHENIFWYEKSLLVSALTLGLLNNFDIAKISLLIRTYLKKLPHISERALTGLILAIYKYDRRIEFYPAIFSELLLLTDYNEFKDDLKALIFQLITTKDTEKLSKKLQEEILPEVIKHAPQIAKNLDIEKLLSDKDEDEKNPKWKEVFKDSPGLYDKLEELSKLQMQGSDMFIGTFAQLKHFPFFNNLINWLLPFYADEKNLKSSLQKELSHPNFIEFLEALEVAPYICNSDKYSFCFNLKALPEQQKLLLFDMFIEETHSLREMLLEEGRIDMTLKSRIIITQYLQDLYRFFKLNPQKFHFEDVFQWKLDIHNTATIKKLINDPVFFKEIADQYFNREHYDEAAIIYESIYQAGNEDLEILQKLGFCFQKLKNYSKAIENYSKADIIDTGNVWIWRKLAYCYLKMEDFQNALKYYCEIEKEDTENWKIQAYIAHCFFNLNEYEKALNIFYKVDLLKPDNPYIIKSIAYTNFLLGKFNESLNHYQKLGSDQLNYNDLMNLGHLYLCLKDRQNASNYYLKSIVNYPDGINGFFRQFENDRALLMKYGVNAEHFPLIIDYLKMSREGKMNEY